MATLEENIHQAIADFDDIEAAIVEMGVDVPDGTDTAEYGNLIRSIPRGTADSPIKRVTSPDAEGNVVYLRDLESGSYVLSGAFKPYEGNNTICKFSSDLLVNVVKGTLKGVPTSHIQIFYPVHNVVQFVDVTDSSYKRTDVKLNDLAYWADVEKLIASASQNYSNALKGHANGETIRLDDVSPIEHVAKAKVGRGRNILPFPYYSKSRTANGVTITVNDDGTITLNGTCTDAAVGFALFVGSMPLKGKYTLSGVTNSGETSHYLQPYIDGAFQASVANGSKTYEFNGNLTQISLFVKSGYSFNNVVVYPQFEIGDVATEYEPYIDPATVTLTKCGKNILGFKESFSVTYENPAITVSYDADSQIFTLDGSFVDGNNPLTGFLTQYLSNKVKISEGRQASLSIEKIGGSVSARQDYNVFYLSCADTPDGARANWFSAVIPTEGKSTNTKPATYDYLNAVWLYISRPATFTNYQFRVLLEISDTATDYEPYIAETYTPNADGIAEISSISPCMTLLSDANVNINVEYNQDSNKAFENVRDDIQELDKVTAELAGNMGDVETALDSIIAIQESLIGGGA